MNTNRTPGPWIAKIEDGKVFLSDSDRDLPVADVFDSDGRSIGYGGDDDEIMENTLLIAAAPDLLDALKEIIAFATPLPYWLIAQAQAAIAKAEGR